MHRIVPICNVDRPVRSDLYVDRTECHMIRPDDFLPVRVTRTPSDLPKSTTDTHVPAKVVGNRVALQSRWQGGRFTIPDRSAWTARIQTMQNFWRINGREVVGARNDVVIPSRRRRLSRTTVRIGRSDAPRCGPDSHENAQFQGFRTNCQMPPAFRRRTPQGVRCDCGCRWTGFRYRNPAGPHRKCMQNMVSVLRAES